jgi:putative hydrolase of the HAD superfamily
MSSITALFWDVGGVVLSNGWNHDARRKACSKFGLDCENFEARHESLVEYLEVGRISLDEYLEQAIFYRHRRFSKDEFKAFIFHQSQPHLDVLPILERLVSSERYLMATLNNESRELNRYRIERFQLRNYFSAFFSSCFLGVRKPEEGIFRVALDVTQRSPEECLMIDDREENLAPAKRLGVRILHYRDARQLESELQRKLPLTKEAT